MQSERTGIFVLVGMAARDWLRKAWRYWLRESGPTTLKDLISRGGLTGFRLMKINALLILLSTCDRILNCMLEQRLTSCVKLNSFLYFSDLMYETPVEGSSSS